MGSDAISLKQELIPLNQLKPKLLHAKGMEPRSETCISTEQSLSDRDCRKRETKDQLKVLIAANTEAEHADFSLCNSFFDRFSQNRTIQVNP